MTPRLIEIAILVIILIALTVGRKRLIRELGGQLAKTMPSQIHCIPDSQMAWLAPELAAYVSQFEAAGFSRVGAFQVPEIGAKLLAFANPAKGVWGTAYNVRGRTMADIYSHLVDGGNITCANSPTTGALESPPKKEVIPAPGAAVGDMVERVVLRRGSREAKPATVEAWQSAFEGAYRSEMAWRQKRGISKEDVQNVARAEGREVNDFQTELVQEAMNKSLRGEEAGSSDIR